MCLYVYVCLSMCMCVPVYVCVCAYACEHTLICGVYLQCICYLCMCTSYFLLLEIKIISSKKKIRSFLFQMQLTIKLIVQPSIARILVNFLKSNKILFWQKKFFFKFTWTKLNNSKKHRNIFFFFLLMDQIVQSCTKWI